MITSLYKDDDNVPISNEVNMQSGPSQPPSDPYEALCLRMRAIRVFLLESFRPDNYLMSRWFQENKENEKLKAFHISLKTILETSTYPAKKDMEPVYLTNNFMESIEVLDRNTERLNATLHRSDMLFRLLQDNISFLERARKNYQLYCADLKKISGTTSPPNILFSKPESEAEAIELLQTVIQSFPMPIKLLHVDLDGDYFVFQYSERIQEPKKYLELFQELIESALEEDFELYDEDFQMSPNKLKIHGNVFNHAIVRNDSQEDTDRNVAALKVKCQEMLNALDSNRPTRKLR